MKRLSFPVSVLIFTFLMVRALSADQTDLRSDVLLREGRFSELESRLEKFHIEKSLNNKGWHKLTEIFDLLAELSIKDLKVQNQLNAWCEHSPSSYLAFTARGYFYRTYADHLPRDSWKNGKATEAGENLFYERLRSAKADLEKAYELNDKAPYAPTAMLHVAARLEKSNEAAWPYFKQAIAADPDHIDAYEWMFDLLKQKWGGSTEEMFTFAEDAVKTHPDDPRFGLLIAYAHHEAAMYSEGGAYDYFSVLAIQQTIKELFSKFLEVYPKSLAGHNFYAHLAYAMKDYPLARQQFEIIGESYIPWAWHYRRSTFENQRRYTYRKTGSLKYTLYNSTRDLWLTVGFFFAFFVLSWRLFVKRKINYSCPQCGKPVVTLWNKLILSPAKFIDCPECRASLSVKDFGAFTLIVMPILALLLGRYMANSLQYLGNLWLMITIVIIAGAFFVHAKFVPLILTDPASVSRKRNRGIALTLIAVLALIGVAVAKNPSILKGGTCSLRREQPK